MKQHKISVLVILLTLVILFFSLTPSATAADLKQGEQIFNAICAACHARGGNIIMGNKTLQKQALEKYGLFSADKIIQQITHGKNAMPAFGERLSSQKIGNVAAYVLDQAEKGWRRK